MCSGNTVIILNGLLFSLQTLKSGTVQEQWLTDLHYCFSMYISGHTQGPTILNTLY